MYSGKKLSGASRRKLARQKEAADNEILKKVPRVTSYFSGVSSQTGGQSDRNEDAEKEEEEEEEEEEEAVEEKERIEENIELDSDEEKQELGIPVSVEQFRSEYGELTVVPPEYHAAPTNLPPASDIAHFEFGKKALSVFEKQFIVRSGSCQPKGPFPKQTDGPNKGRCFSEYFYMRKTKSGINLHRTWLSYSPVADKCYCTHCWLFSPIPNATWTEGTCDWKNLTRNIDRHEISSAHLEACQTFNTWKNDATVDLLTDKQINENRKYWRQVLDRIVNLIITLSRCNLAFRGHREENKLDGDDDKEDNAGSRGNFLEFIHLIARYDPVLENLLRQPQGSTKYLSGAIQNEVIEILAERVKQQIINEIVDAPFVSVIMDTTVDNSKTDQLSKIFRYVTVQKSDVGIPVDMKIRESFLGFSAVESQKAEDLASVITAEIESVTEMRKVRGQGYDGAANMSGTYGGVQKLMKQKAPNARYIHCSAHALNLVVNDAVKNVPQVRNFFDMLEKLYVFFSAISRWSRLQKEGSCAVTLKRLCPTRWSSRNQALVALRSRFVDVMKLLSALSLTGKNAEERGEAASLKKYFESFSSIVSTVLLSKILGPLDIISKDLQSKTSDLTTACVLLESVLQDLVALRNDWETVLSSAKVLAESWSITCEFDNSKRTSRVKRFHDELASDVRLESAEKRYEVEVFNRVVDFTLCQLKSRFQSLRETDELFMCLKPEIIIEKNEDELVQLSKQLTKMYADDISDELSDQLLLLKLTFRTKLLEIRSIRELAELLLIKNADLASSLSEVINACLLYLTLPVTVASAERSFSKLKLIKTYLRSTMSEIRLSSLAILSIESQRLNDINTDDIIDAFANAKARRKKF